MQAILPNPAPLSPGFSPHLLLAKGPLAFPPIPALLATRLQLELLLGDRTGPVDLGEAAALILNDVGATLEIFRVAGEECCDPSDTQSVASRLEDCLASLPTQVWMDAVCADAVERLAVTKAEHARLTGFWEHARLLAYACWVVAEHLEGVCPEEAYLVGLLHDAGHLPQLLGWELPRGGAQRSNTHLLALLAEHWRLPAYLRAVIAAPASVPVWADLLETAHAWAEGEGFLGCTA